MLTLEVYQEKMRNKMGNTMLNLLKHREMHLLPYSLHFQIEIIC